MDTVSTAANSVNRVGQSVNTVLGTANAVLGTANAAVDATGEVVQNVGSVIGTAAHEGAQVTNQGIRQVSQIAQNALSVTGNSLETVFGTLNILAAKGSEKVRVKTESTAALYDVRRIAGLKSEIQSEFGSKMGYFIEKLKDYSGSQKNFIRQLLAVYKTARCAKGKFYGHTCPMEVGAAVAAFERKLNVVMASSEAAAFELRGLILKVEPSLMAITEPGLERYKEAALKALSPLCVESANVYSRIVQQFSNLTEEINAEPQNGGRRKKRGEISRRKKLGKISRRKKRSVKHGRPRTHPSSARRPRRLPKSHRHAPRRARAAPSRAAHSFFH